MTETVSKLAGLRKPRAALVASRVGIALFLPLTIAGLGVLGIFVGPSATQAVRTALTGAGVDPVMTGSVRPPLPSGYGVPVAPAASHMPNRPSEYGIDE